MAKIDYTISGYVHTTTTMDITGMVFSNEPTVNDQWFVGMSSGKDGLIDGGYIKVDANGIHIPEPVQGDNPVTLDYYTGHMTGEVHDPVTIGTANGLSIVDQVLSMAAGTTAVVGTVQLTDSISSTSTTTAATPNSVKSAYDAANSKVDTSGSPTTNDYAKFTDANTVEGRSYTEVKSDLSLDNVDNTSDANKPVSTAQQTAIDLKLNITDKYTDTEAVDAVEATGLEMGADIDMGGNSLRLLNDDYHRIVNNNNDAVIAAAEAYEDLHIFGNYGVGFWHFDGTSTYTQQMYIDESGVVLGNDLDVNDHVIDDVKEIVVGDGTYSTNNPRGITCDDGAADTPGIHFYYATDTNYGIDVGSNELRFVHNLDESGGAVKMQLSNGSRLNLINGTIVNCNSIGAYPGNDLTIDNDLNMNGNAIINHYCPAFKANSSVTTAFSSTAKQTFPTEVYDNEGNYDAANSKFTAPVAGIYHFDVQVLLTSTVWTVGDYCIMRIYKNGVLHDDGVWFSCHNTATIYCALFYNKDLQLAVNDYIEVYITEGRTGGSVAKIGTARYNSFGGHLVTRTS